MEKIVNHFLTSENYSLPKWFQISESEVKEIGHYLKDHLLNGSPKEKLRSLEMFRSISEYSPSMLRYISRRVIKYIFDWALYKGTEDSPSRGLLLFNSSEASDQQASADFLISFLDSIEFWGKVSTPESNLKTAYEKLLDSKITLFRIAVNKEIIGNKLQDVQDELQKLSIRTQEIVAETETKLQNLLFYIRSIRVLCSSNSKLESSFDEQLRSYEIILKKMIEQVNFHQNLEKVVFFPPFEGLPKVPPRADSPIDYEMVKIDEEVAVDEGEYEWRSIKDEFIRLKDFEKIIKVKVSRLQDELNEKDSIIHEKEFWLKEKQIEIDFIRKEKLKIVEEFKKFKTNLESLLEEKETIISVMSQNKGQMREVFLAKEKENEELCMKIEELQNEISNYCALDTTRFNTTDRRISRFSSFIEENEEPENLKYFSTLLCVSEGILFKSRSIEVGIRLKIEKESGKAFVYIGNCMQKPLDYLETFIFSPEINIEMNQDIENSHIPPSAQANRILSFKYLKSFSIFPKLTVRYNSSKKTLQLPVTPALFLNKLEGNPEEHWQKEFLFDETVKCQVPSSKLHKALLFQPSFQSLVVEPDIYLYTEEVIIKISHMDLSLLVCLKSNDAELLSAIFEMCKIQISFIEALITN